MTQKQWAIISLIKQSNNNQCLSRSFWWRTTVTCTKTFYWAVNIIIDTVYSNNILTRIFGDKKGGLVTTKCALWHGPYMQTHCLNNALLFIQLYW